MRNKLISVIAATALLLVSFVPVMAEDFIGSKTATPVTGEGAYCGNGTVQIEVVANGGDATDKAQIIVNTTGDGTADVKTILNSSASVEAFLSEQGVAPANLANAKAMALLDLSANATAKETIKGNGGYVMVPLSVAGVKKGDKVLALHWKSAQDKPEVIESLVEKDGVVLVKMGSDFSPVMILTYTEKSTSGKTDTNTETNTNSGTTNTKVVTCESEHGKGWTWSESKNACVYKVTNTGAK